MAILNVIDNSYARLSYDTEKKIVFHTFHEGLDTAHFQMVLNKGIEILREHGAIKWLADTRAIKPLTEEQGRWIATDWLPRAVTTGWKYWALVVPDSIESRASMAHHVDFFEGKGVRLNTFTKMDEAWAWLEKAGK